MRPSKTRSFGILVLSLLLVSPAAIGQNRAERPAAGSAGAAAPWPARGSRPVANPTALDRYVARDDPSYAYELVASVPGEGYTAHVLRMTSQRWRSTEEVDRPLWEHWLTIIQPGRVSSSTGFLFISGGSNGGKPPGRVDPSLLEMALGTQSVAADLRMVPNEPLTFRDEGRPRTEDGLIAYTWDKYLRTGDETWPLRLPMTKSAVRAMDTVSSFCADADRGRVPVDRFVVAGGSKRGWTAWTTAAVDDRVAAVIPFVIDILNSERSMDHHYRAYGFWAPAVSDYTEMGIMDWNGTPPFKALMRIEDPYSYRERLTLPKYIVNSTGDQYFLPDSSRFYFDDLKGEKHLRYVPNTRHDLRNSDARESLWSFYESVLRGTPRPRYSWRFEEDGTIRVQTTDEPTEVRLWQATNPKARDFRLDSIGPAFRSEVIAPRPAGLYEAKAEAPPAGWTAYFIELTFSGPGKYPLKFTTGVRVAPDVLPSPSYKAKNSQAP